MGSLEGVVSVIVRDVGMMVAVALALAFLVSLFLYKRQDVSWVTFLLAGPMTVLRPSRYLRADRARLPPMLLSLTMFFFVVAWFANWFVNNR